MLPALLLVGFKAWMVTGSCLAGNASTPDGSLARDEIPVGSNVAEQATRKGAFIHSTKSENSAGRSVDGRRVVTLAPVPAIPTDPPTLLLTNSAMAGMGESRPKET